MYHPREVGRPPPPPHNINNIYTGSIFTVNLQDIAVTASPDSTIRVWNVDTAACSQVIKVGIVQFQYLSNLMCHVFRY